MGIREVLGEYYDISVFKAIEWYGDAIVHEVELAPQYLRREYIHGGYRVGGGFMPALRSLFELHNETLNAWTMVWLSAASSLFLFYVHRALGFVPVPFWCAWLSVVLHLPFSAGLHLFIGISENTRKVWRTFDVFFIQFCSVLLAAGMGYYVVDRYYSVYMAVTVAAFVRSIYSTMVVRRIWSISKPELAKQVAVLVVAYTLPVVVQTLSDVSNGLYWDGTLPHCLVLAFILETGRQCYSKHLPEKWAPGRFDYFGNSHQIMHIMALFAHVLEMAFIYRMYNRTHPYKLI
eukprot:Plantae.Rhodophyta-Purpureofilum_apyrenoidigerum.ctg20262.p1 GENE.Plantae.Rhodophyta-Purpureofilum_apyrenoidigerum.ctg20262~~Plantae.Rhodophyta-Purpureofilum_apyrenoidigerum.ctg20262.p1  ORF type:complete len:290 (+),score=35.49 Plantae.Rhodophyta-Purpureofilum_apyrenoidigerum.ctg20262:76-945(+)